jgi:uncharacterized membrane protein
MQILGHLAGADIALLVSVFIACAVEAVEAVTIVLAAGTARDWKSAGRGTIAALVLLAILVGAFGPAISRLPIGSLRITVGILLLVFGLQWLRKAILRASGYKALHDEDKIFRDELAAARAAGVVHRFGVGDWYAFTLAFKGVLLEGLEVVFIVVTFGALQKRIGLASIAAALAVAITTIAGFVLARPLAKVPENTMKFTVGTLLTAFGLFWSVEGAGAKWPGDNWSVLALIAFVFIVAAVLTQVLKSKRASFVAQNGEKSTPTAKAVTTPAINNVLVRAVKGFVLFWYDFIVGDDPVVAILVAIGVVLTAALKGTSAHDWYLMPIFMAAALAQTLARASR